MLHAYQENMTGISPSKLITNYTSRPVWERQQKLQYYVNKNIENSREKAYRGNMALISNGANIYDKCLFNFFHDFNRNAYAMI